MEVNLRPQNLFTEASVEEISKLELIKNIFLQRKEAFENNPVETSVKEYYCHGYFYESYRHVVDILFEIFTLTLALTLTVPQ